MNKQQKMTAAAEVLAKAMKQIDGLTPLPKEAEEGLRTAFEQTWWSAGQKLVCGGDDVLESHDTWALCGRLGRLVEAQTPGGELARQFAEALAQETDGETPDTELMEQAADAFDALPDAEKRSILNGWAPIERSDRQEYEGVTARVAFADFLDVEAAADGTVRGAVEPWPDPDGVVDVRLLVAIGTSKERVLAGLDAIKRALDEQWGVLTAPEPQAAEVAA